MTYLITGATGNIVSRVVECLLKRGDRPWIFVRDAAKGRARFGDHVDVAVGDLADTGSLSPALAGVDALFLVNSGPDLDVRDRAAAIAAKASGVKHLVKLSTLDARTGVGTGVWHAQGESAIRESGIGFTFIQSAAFMVNCLAWAPSIKAEGVVRAATGDGKIAFIHPDDIADVATKSLTTRNHDGESLVITGPEALSYAEMTTKVGVCIGRPLKFLPTSDEEARRASLARGLSRPYADALASIFRAIREGRLATVTDGVERVVGRKPIPFDRWAQENAAAFR
jgi:uncharacterized protein YbjT (DUF2867 family)